MSAEEIKNIVSILRALVLSQKYPTKVRELLKDFREMEGYQIPFKKFGYQSAEEFLKSSKEFSLLNHEGELSITARPTKESAHISHMISSQKSTRKRRKTNLSSFRHPSTISHQSWNKSSFSSNIYQHKLNQNNVSNRNGNNAKNYRFQGDSNNNFGQSNNRNLSRQQNQKNIISQKQYQTNNICNAKSHSVKENDLRYILNSKQQSKPNNDLRSKLEAKKNEQKNPEIPSLLDLKIAKIPSLLELKTTKPSDKNLNGKTNLKIEINNKTLSNESRTKRNISTVHDKKSKPSVQDRLKIHYDNPPPLPAPSLSPVPLTPNKSTEDISQSFSTKINLTDINDTETTVIQNIENKPILKNLPNFEFDNSLNPIQALEEYCKAKNYEIPIYETIKPKYNKDFQCRVNINGVMYSTYPKEYTNIEAAQIASAKIAIEEIKLAISNKNSYPVWSDSDRELTCKIYEDIEQNHPHGIFAKLLPKIFEESFKIVLPDHWFSVLIDSKRFLMEDIPGGDKIIFINTNTNTEMEDIMNSTDCCDELKLPWDEQYWNLYVTNCISTVEIWARIVGPEYSKSLDALLTEIELNMLTNMQRPSSITEGKYYLVCLSECWHRVRLERIDKDKGTCICFFIDFGDEDDVPMEQLYICDTKFLKLPPQAIVFSLFGLEDFAENPIAKQLLIETLMGKSLVAEIETKKDIFDKNCGAASINTYNLTLKIPKIQIVLYDTSDPKDDINLNPLLLKKISDETPPPELKRDTATNVTITHVTDKGDIFLQIRSNGLLYIQKLIYQLVESKFNEDYNKVTLEDISKPSIFLIKDNEDNKWYRGCLAADKNRDPNDESYEVFYIDFGITKQTHVGDIFRLESLSTALSKFPRQAIKVKLHNIPNISKNIVGRIKALLPINYPAIVKLVDLKLEGIHNLVPYIIAYVRFERNPSLCNVNESIKIEYELERSSEISVQNVDHTYIVKSQLNNGKNLETLNQHIVKSSIPESLTPNVGEFFNVFVTVSSNPYNFLVRPYDNFLNFQQHMDSLKEYFSKRDEYIVNDMIQIGEVYVYVADDGICSRVEVEGQYSSQMSCVVRIDYGDIIIVNNSQLRVLPEKFRKIPQQATKAKLYGIKPVDADWTTEDSLRFRELTVGQKFVAMVMKVSTEHSDSKYIKLLELQLIDVNTTVDIYIHKIFVDEKRGVST